MYGAASVLKTETLSVKQMKQLRRQENIQGVDRLRNKFAEREMIGY